MFQKAKRTDSRLRIALMGPAGSGKTYSALRVGMGLLGAGQRLAVVDTEHGSASLYADEANPDGGAFDFDAVRLDQWEGKFSVQNYLRAIQGAADAGYPVLVVDSLSHAWAGPGGVLDYVDTVAEKKRGNKFGAWREGTAEQNALVDALLSYPGHLICTVRTKVEYVNENGKVRKVGLQPVQRDGLEYEFTVCGDIDVDTHKLTISKSRCTAVAGTYRMVGADMARQLIEWIGNGAPPPPPFGVEEFNTALAEVGVDADAAAWFCATQSGAKAAPGDMTEPQRRKAVDFLTSDAGKAKLAEAVKGLRDQFRNKFFGLWRDLYVVPTKGSGASKDDIQDAEDTSESARKHLLSAWYGVESMKDLTLDHMAAGEHSLQWLRNVTPEAFAEAVTDVTDG